jgi:hypothetical protein
MKTMGMVGIGVGIAAAVWGGVLWFSARTETSTRLICVDSQVCTEYFSLKDGSPVRSVCPSEGGERYPLRPGCTRSGKTCQCP